jgi:hypothetical protein
MADGGKLIVQIFIEPRAPVFKLIVRLFQSVLSYFGLGSVDGTAKGTQGYQV